MCLHPRKVISPTTSFKPGCSKVLVNTQCNECFECQQAKKNDWFLRCYSEWKDTSALGGKSFFVTLTYAPEFLPHFSCRYNGSSPDGIKEHTLETPCFSLQHIQTFVNTLRKKLLRMTRRYRKDSKAPSDYHFKYIFFPEYGSKTQRPHYHCLFFFDKPISNRVFFSLIDGYDNDEQRHKFFKFDNNKHYFHTKEHPGLHGQGAWKYGWILVSKPSKGGIEIKSEKSISYVSKYAVKDLSFYKKQDVRHFLSSLRNKNIAQPFDRYEMLSLFDQHSAKHRQSINLGYNWLVHEFLSDVDKHLVDGFTIGNSSDSVYHKTYQMPAYFMRKLLYRYETISNPDGNDFVRWRYVPKNFPLYLKLVESRIKDYENTCSHLCTYINVKHLSHSDLNVLGFDTHESLYNELLQIRPIIHNLSIFKYVYANRNCSFDPVTGDSFDTLNYDMSHYINNYSLYLEQFLNMNDEQILTYKYFNSIRGAFSSIRDDSTLLYNSLSIFSNYTYYIDLIDTLNLVSRSSEYAYQDYLDTFARQYKNDDNSHKPHYTVPALL